MNLKRRASPTLVLVGLAVMAVGVPARQGFWPFTRLRDPTGLEEFQYLVAINFKSPAVCERIDRHVMSRTGGGGWDSPRGFDVQAMRSECFRNLAAALHDAALCDRVFPVRTLLENGSGYDRRYCLAHVKDNDSAMALPDVHNMKPFIGFLQKIGFGAREVVDFHYQKNAEIGPVHAGYTQVRTNAEFLARLRAAPSYAGTPEPDGFRPAKPVEVLYQMVAVDTPEPSLCARVSPNATLVDYGGKTALLRSRCYVSIAYNTRDQSLCDQLPRLGSSPYVIDYDSLEGCRTTVAIYRRPGFNSGGLRDGFMPFAHASDFTDALRQIGQATPTASQLENLEDDDYWQFVTRLSREGKPQERAEFVRRTLTLR